MPSLRFNLMLGGLVLLGLGTTPARADHCPAAKLRLVGKEESRLLTCQARYAAGAYSLIQLLLCEGNVTRTFEADFFEGACAGDEATCESIGVACTSSVAGAFIDVSPSACEAAKRQAAAKLAKDELRCYSKAAAKDLPIDTVRCIPKATGRFSRSLANAGICPDGGSPQTFVEDHCVKSAVTTDGTGRVTGVCPTP